MRASLSTASACALVLTLGACRPAAPAVDAPPQPVTVATAADLAHDNLNAVLWVQASEEYGAVTTSLYRAAAEQLDKALQEKNWDALVPSERDATHAGLPPAVIMDVDETVLDNSPYQARLVRDGLEYDEVSWAQWVAEKQAPAVPGVVDFARAATARGVTILYLSNRAEHLQEATLANLRAAGLPVKDDSVFLGLGRFVADCEQQGTEKGCRRRLASASYRVLMQFGDQLGDFVEIPANTVEGRAALAKEHGDWFGERWWMLPNPTYGSWEPALFNNAWAEPPAARRADKRARLELLR